MGLWKPIVWVLLLVASLAAGAWLVWAQELAPQLQGAGGQALADGWRAALEGEVIGQMLVTGIAFFLLSALAGALVGVPFAILGRYAAAVPIAGWGALAVFTYLAVTG